MFKYLLKSAFRNILNNRIYSFLNFSGLSIGIASFLLLFLWIKDEVNYNKFNANYNEIYRLYSEYQEKDNVWQTQLTPDMAAPLLVGQYPGIKNAVRLKNQASTIKVGEDLFNEENLFYTDPSFFEIFTSEVVYGDPHIALSDPNSVVLTSHIAKKYFGNKNPINKTILVDGIHEFNVAAVVRNFPNNTDVNFDLLLPYKFLEDNNLMWRYWSFGRIETYILAGKGKLKKQLDFEIKDFMSDKGPDLGFVFKVQPLRQLHLYSLDGEKAGMKTVQIFALIALCILVIACFNFINLTTAQYTKRSKEISLKQILGSSKLGLVKNIFFETGLFVLISGVFALIFIELFRMPFNKISGKELTINYLDLSFIGYLFLIFFITSIISALYPAYFITKFKSLNLLTGEITKGLRGKRIRKLIVIFQFTLSIILVISSITIFRQFDYLKNKDLGYNTSNIVYLPLKGVARNNYGLIKQQIKNSPFIENVSVVSELPNFVGIGTSNYNYEGKDPADDKGFTILSVDHDFLETIDLELSQGKDFSLDFNSDSSNYILNEKAIQYMGLENPVGSKFSMFDIEGEIIGVVKDFHFKPLNEPVEPIFLAIVPNYYSYFMIKLNDKSIPNGINHIEKVWNEFLHDYAFEYDFWDDHKTSIYRSEKRMINIFLYFTLLAILIAAIGLVGLSMFTTEIKTKEIGVKKVNGANTLSIIKMFIKDYSIWILVSIIIACPIAYYVMDKWLQDYAYRIDLSIWIFIISVVFVYVIGILSIIVQSYKAAKAKPVESLRYE